MIVHKDLESDCKRIAEFIMKVAKDPLNEQFDDMISFGKITVDVSKSLITELNKDRWKHHKEWEKQINNNLKGCSISIDTTGYCGYCYISFFIEFDDVDAETEDW